MLDPEIPRATGIVMVVRVGIEPTLTSNLEYRVYKARRAASYTTGRQFV